MRQLQVLEFTECFWDKKNKIKIINDHIVCLCWFLMNRGKDNFEGELVEFV